MSGMRNAFLVAILGSLATVTYAADWATYRGDNARRGISQEKLSCPLVKQWEFRTGGPIRSSPVVIGNAVIFGSCDHKVYCLDLKTGKLRWSFITGALVESTGAAEGELVCIGSDDGNVYALRVPDGRPAWTFKASDKAHWVGYNDGYFISTQAVRGGLAIHNGVVYFSCGVLTFEGGSACAVRLQDGRLVWQNKEFLVQGDSHDTALAGAPVVANGNLYFASGGLATAFDLESGRFLWRRSMEGSTDCLQLSLVRDALWTGEAGGTHGTGRVYCLSLDNKLVVAKGFSSGGCYAAPVYVEDRLYLPIGQRIVALDYGKLIARCEKGDFAKLEEFAVWRSSPLGSEDQPPILCCPALAGELLLVGGNSGRFVALGIRDGKEAWECQLDGAVTTSPAISQGCVLVGTQSGIMYCFGSSPKKP